MRTFLILMLFAFALSTLNGCKKPQEEVQDKDAITFSDKAEKKVEILPPNVVAQGLARALCEKQANCETAPEFNKEKCTQAGAAGLTPNLTSKNIQINQEKLDLCAYAIQKGNCDVLISSTPPTGCEFMR